MTETAACPSCTFIAPHQCARHRPLPARTRGHLTLLTTVRDSRAANTRKAAR